MYAIREKSPFAGMTVKIKDNFGATPITGKDFSSMDFEVEDWWQNVYGKSWMSSNGNLAALNYAFRAAYKRLPIDNDVLYGKIDGLGYLFHVSELNLPEVS